MSPAVTPRFSVVIPTYNRAHTLMRAISSVLEQTLTDFELIVVDDGSADGTHALVSALTDPRIRVLRQGNAGRSSARNAGAATAAGVYLAFLDSDDEVLPGWLAAFDRCLSQAAATVACCGATIRFKGGHASTRLPRPLGPVYCGYSGLFLAGTFAIDRQLFHELGGYDPRLAFSENTDLALRLTRVSQERGLRFGLVSSPLLTVHESTRTTGAPASRVRLSAAEFILARHGGRYLKHSPDGYANYCAVAAVHATLLGEVSVARRHLLRAIRSNPWKLRHWARLAAVGASPSVARAYWRRQGKPGAHVGDADTPSDSGKGEEAAVAQLSGVGSPLGSARSLSVLFVIDGLWSGGTERSLAELLPALRGAGVDCAVACLREREEGVEEEVRGHGFAVHVLGGDGVLAQARSLRRLVKRLRPDIVHSSLFNGDMVSRIGLVGLNVVLVNSLVNNTYGPARLADPTLNSKRVRALQAVDAVTARLLVDHFHAVSESSKRDAVRDLRLPPARITVARRGRDARRLGAPTPARRTATRRALGLPDSAVVLISVGRQDNQKGQVYLLRAAHTLIPMHSQVQVLLVGRPGSASDSLADHTKQLGLANHVRFLGHRDDVPDLLAAADVFTFPSLWEGYPGAVLEAMALGLPVVASDIAPVREIVASGVTGLLFPPGEPDALAAALSTLISDPELRRRFGAEGRRRFLSCHTLEASVQALLALYCRLAEAKVTSPPAHA